MRTGVQMVELLEETFPSQVGIGVELRIPENRSCRYSVALKSFSCIGCLPNRRPSGNGIVKGIVVSGSSEQG